MANVKSCTIFFPIDIAQIFNSIAREHRDSWGDKVEHYHDFADHLNFGSRAVLRTNSRVDQEIAVIANQLVANAVILQPIADQTRIIQDLKREGYAFDLNDAKHSSPFLHTSSCGSGSQLGQSAKVLKIGESYRAPMTGDGAIEPHRIRVGRMALT